MGSSRNRSVNAAVPAPDTALIDQAPLVESTWRSDVLIPLTTNLLSGMAVGGGIAIMWYLIARNDLPGDWWIPCAAAGALWAIAWTIVRYNGDELGMFGAAYRAGRASRDAEVNHLTLQLHTLYDAMTANGGKVSATESNEMIARMNATIEHARTLLRVIYEHGPKHATRQEMAQRFMGQRDWERARSLCIAAGACDNVLQPLMASYAAALKAVEQKHLGDVAEVRKSKSYHPAWA